MYICLLFDSTTMDKTQLKLNCSYLLGEDDGLGGGCRVGVKKRWIGFGAKEKISALLIFLVQLILLVLQLCFLSSFYQFH